MNSNRIKDIQQTTAYPESVSVMQVLKQVWNECEQDNLKAIDELKAENERLMEQRDSAIFYIDECPCDPDIYPEQWEAWEKYQQLCHGKKAETIKGLIK
jgi:hypothetical protein